MRAAGNDSERPTEIPERLFRQGEDWAWLKAKRREERRRRIKAALHEVFARRRWVAAVAVAAPVLLLALGWLIGGQKW
ncbi:MAG: hypothetical protein AB7E80_09870 [Hyphomicrobiaceae bacterium]